MTLAERLSEYVRAASPASRSSRPSTTTPSPRSPPCAATQGWSLATWDVDRGLAVAGPTERGRRHPRGRRPAGGDPSLPALATADGTALLVLRNFHRFLGSAEVVQALDTRLAAGKQDRTFVVVLAPVVQVPVELEKLFVVLEHDLPGRDQLAAIARGVATEPGELPDGDGLDAVLDAAAGLTRVEAENAFSLSLVRHGRLAPDVLWEIKGGTLKKAGLLTLHRGGESFADLGGLEALKAFCARALRPGRPAGVRARGILLLGVPGTGKSIFAKALGNETGRPTLVLDIGALLGSLVGQSEAAGPRGPAGDRRDGAVRRLVRRGREGAGRVQGAARATRGSAPGSSGRCCRGCTTTSPTPSSSAPANDIAKLPPEFGRAERFDAIVLPRPARRGREGGDLADVPDAVRPRPGAAPARRTATGRRRRSAACCRLAALLDIPLAGGGDERRAGRGDGGRGGRAAPHVGGRAVPGGGPPRAVHRAAGPPPGPAATSDATRPRTDDDRILTCLIRWARSA